MIDGRTRLVGLIGWPVAHSLSPVMHNAVFDALGLNWRYVPLPVPPGQVADAVCGLAALGFQGANVTVPHKQTVMTSLASITPDAKRLGAVNTLLIEHDANAAPTLRGDNTDARGFMGALREGGVHPDALDRAVVVGAGGAARAVAFGLLEAGVKDIVVLNRTHARAEALVADLGAHYSAGQLQAQPLTPEALVSATQDATLLVNATSVGMWPHVEASIWPDEMPIPAHLAVFDLVYNPLETQLLRQARQAGAYPINGLGMLVRQGALALAMWVKQEVDMSGLEKSDEVATLMRTVCEQALNT